MKPAEPDVNSEESALSDFEKKISIIKDGSNILSGIKNLVIIFAAGFFLIFVLNFPPQFAILIGVEVAITIAGGFIRIKQIENFYASDVGESAEGYRKLLIGEERYNLIKSGVALVIDFIAAVLVSAFFYNEITGFSVQFLNYLGGIFLLKRFVFVFAGYRMFESIMRAIRYEKIRQIPESNDFAEMDREFVSSEKKMNELNILPASGVFLVTLISMPFPLYITLSFLGIVTIGAALSLFEFYNGKKFQEDQKNETLGLEFYPKEQILYFIFGIINAKIIPRTLGFLRKSSASRENAIILTDKRILFVNVPLSKSKLNDRSSVLKKIAGKQERGVNLDSMPKVLKLGVKDVLYDDVRYCALGKSRLLIEKNNREKLKYLLTNKRGVKTLGEYLLFYLKDRFVQVG